MLRQVYQKRNLSFSELLELDNPATRNLQVLVTEIFKVKNNLSPEIMKQVFDFQKPYYNLRASSRGKYKKNTLWHPVCRISRTQYMGHGTSEY